MHILPKYPSINTPVKHLHLQDNKRETAITNCTKKPDIDAHEIWQQIKWRSKGRKKEKRKNERNKKKTERQIAPGGRQGQEM